MTNNEKTIKELESGLSSFVDLYKLHRSNCNLTEAISIRDTIKNIIETKNLVAELVWGVDPDDKQALELI